MTSPVPGSAVDPLGDVLHTLRLAGTFYCHSELTEPWGMTVPAMPDHLWFHIVTAGHCVLDVAGTAERVVRPGEVVLVPHGRGHRVCSHAGVAAPDVRGLPQKYLNDHYVELRHGGDGPERTTLVCGGVRFGHPAARELVALLPRLVHVNAAESARAEWLSATLRLIAAEAAADRPGGETVMTRLSDVVVIQTIRSWLDEESHTSTGWLAALRHPQIGRAIALLHRYPDRAWTVAALASEVAMSRSAFAARFTETAGETVMSYLTRWRMRLALDWLTAEHATVSALAGSLGYRSEAAFSRAFKRINGISPSAVKTVPESVPALAAEESE